MSRTLTLSAVGGALLLSTFAGPAQALGLPAASSPASSPAGTACSGDQGVTVVVQTPTETLQGCAEGDPTSGEEALTAAGFELKHDDSGMVCSIGHEGTWYPQEGKDGWTCGDFDGTFWSYWTAEESADQWTTSQVGAGEHDPKPGEATGWRHGDGKTEPADGTVPAADESAPSGSASGAASPSETAAASASASESEPAETSTTTSDQADADASGGDNGWLTWALLGGALLVGAGIVAAVLRRR